MVKLNLFVFLLLFCLISEILSCDKCGDSSSSSSEECACQKRHKHKKRKCLEETSTAIPTTTTPAITCEKSSIDLVFVVDSSGSVGARNFNKVLNALIATVQYIDVGPDKDQSHIGMVTFDSIAFKIFGLNKHLTTESVQTAISQVTYAGYGTFIEAGMTLAIEDVFSQAGNRPNSSDIMIVITDGHDMSNVSGAQQLASSKNITVFSVGVGSEPGQENLELARIDPIPWDSIVSDSPDHGSCDYEKMIQQLTDISREEFCLVRPYCNKIC